MVHSGMLRAFGGPLRRFLIVGLTSRWAAFAAGMGITAALQSSTATGLMASGFIAGGLMALAPALAVMLGANVGSTVIVQILTFNIGAVAPVFILAGVIAFKRGGSTRIRDFGRVSIGLGLVILALHLIVELLKPVGQAAAMRDLLTIVGGEPALNIVFAAILTWAMHSSVATVLLIMSLAAANLILPATALLLAPIWERSFRNIWLPRLIMRPGGLPWVI
jgi:phosphate:Na+ symporter